MPQLAELTRGVWLDERLGEEVRRDVEALCQVLESGISDAFLSLVLFQEAISAEADNPDPRDQFKAIRDSIEHVEERIRWLDLAGRMDTPVLVIGSLSDDRTYVSTVHGGRCAEFEVAEETLETARQIVQRVFDALPWVPGARISTPSLWSG